MRPGGVDYGHALLLAYVFGPDAFWYLGPRRVDSWGRPLSRVRQTGPVSHGYYGAWARHWMLRRIVA